MTENSTLVADYRQMSNGQLGIAGVAIAVISMIVEFIALSGFSPSVSGDENVRRRSLPNRRMDRGDENYEISKSAKRERKRKRLLKALANIKQVEQREKDTFDDKYDYDYYDNYDSLMSSPYPIKDFTKNTNLLFQKNPVPNFPQQFGGSGWPTKLNDAFKNTNVNNNNYVGLHTNPNPQSQIAGRRIAIHGARHNPRLRRPIRPYLRQRKKPKVVFGVLRNVPSPPQRADVVYPYGIGAEEAKNGMLKSNSMLATH